MLLWPPPSMRILPTRGQTTSRPSLLLNKASFLCASLPMAEPIPESMLILPLVELQREHAGHSLRGTRACGLRGTSRSALMAQQSWLQLGR